MVRPHVHIPYAKIGEHLDFIIRNNIDLEIYFSSDSLDVLSSDDIRSLKNKLQHEPELSFHAPFMDLCPGAVDSGVRDITVGRFNQVLDIAGILNPLSIVMHSGYDKWKYGLNPQLWLDKSLETWIPINARAESMGVKLAIENIFEDEPSNLVMLMEAMGSENFGICFDTGHCNLFSRVPLEEWIRCLKAHIIELHLHDNDKGSDQHRPIGDGTFNFEWFFNEIKDISCVYTIEAHTPEDALKGMERLAYHLSRTD